MTDVTTLQTRLSSAEAAYDKLVAGASMVEIRHGQNELMRFTPATAGRLAGYISDLKGQLRAAGVFVRGGRIRGRRVYS